MMDVAGQNENRPTKRRKKDPNDSRAERKRELDRIAQRATRERTKNKIADLEQRLASLESGDKNSEIAHLTRTIGELRDENGKYQNALVKMRFAINEALGEIDESNRRDSSSTISVKVNGDHRGSITQLDALPIDSPVLESIQSDVLVLADDLYQAPPPDQRLQTFYDTQGYRPPSPNDFSTIDVNGIFEFFQYGQGNPFMNPSPLTGRMPPAGGVLDFAPDRLKWKTSDDAFGQGLAAPAIQLDFDEGVLARAFLLGWDSIGALAETPILFALRNVDQRVFHKWISRPQRLATLYCCACLMRWKANPTEGNKLKVPPWFLPRPAQEKIQHPLVIDFLIWPGLRERLVFEYEKYNTADGDFSFCFTEYFHFNWPFSDEATCLYDQNGLICGLSKIFKEFAYDLGNFTMLPPFFNRFPEMRADIGMWVEPPNIAFPKATWT